MNTGWRKSQHEKSGDFLFCGAQVDKKYQKQAKTAYCPEPKQLKRQHGQQQNRSHNPKVGGLNPSAKFKVKLAAVEGAMSRRIPSQFSRMPPSVDARRVPIWRLSFRQFPDLWPVLLGIAHNFVGTV
jgi:hypothetical protein